MSGRELFRRDESESLGASFDTVDLAGADLRGTWAAPDFSGCNLEGACLKAGDFYWTIFFRANLSNADLRDADLRGADLKYANLQGADLRGALLKEDELRGSTKLQGADLRDSLLDGANLNNAAYDTNTRFPVGFDPNRHCMIKVDIES
jgi:uncharacterized protein YjbI with pentapeptide repeats